MPKGNFTNPPPLTESARAARAAFHCDLCMKGYSRQNEFDSHLTSYEHNHNQRLKDLKSITRNMAAETRPKADKDDGLIKIQPITMGGPKKEGGGFKKGGFKSAFAKVDEPAVIKKEVLDDVGVVGSGNIGKGFERLRTVEPDESDTEDEGYQCYDPRKPTGCKPGCKGRA
jgi:hypothetical protein